MENNTRATYLSLYSSVTELSIEDASMMLIAYADSNDVVIGRMNAFLVGQVRGESWEWINNDAIDIVVLRIRALSRNSSSAIDGAAMAYLAKRLIGLEVVVGGPYYDDQGRVTIETNAMIAQLFHTLESPLENVDQFVSHELKAQAKLSKWLYWLVSWPFILSPLEHSDGPSVTIKEQCIDHCFGRDGASEMPTGKAPENTVSRAVRDELSPLPVSIRSEALLLYESVLRADTRQEISLLSTYFDQSLMVSKTDASMRTELGMANFYSWMAYTIYDDVIDDEARPSSLPIANIAHRRAIAWYAKYAHRSRSLVEGIFDQMDYANAWELRYCRFSVIDDVITIGMLPDYDDFSMLADRASAHILGPLLIVNAEHYDTIRVAFRHYLIARQLNDDIHDWVKDLKDGHISPVVAGLLSITTIAAGAYVLSDIQSQLERSFWESELERWCDEIIDHIHQSKVLFNQSGLFKQNSLLFEKLLDPIEVSVNESIELHRNDHLFFDTYRR